MTTIISSVFVYSEPIPNIVIFIAFFFFLFSLPPPAFSYVDSETKRYWKVHAEIMVQEEKNVMDE